MPIAWTARPTRAHNKWVQLASGLPAGFYRLNVNTSLDPANLNTGAENLFSIWVKASSGNARVYGSGRMAAYTNLDGGNQTFYFAQIEKVHAGKQMEIQLFDPGEASGNAFLRFLNPDGNSYQYATFDWVSDDGRSGNDVTVLQTSTGGPLFNNRLITITIDLPNDLRIRRPEPARRPHDRGGLVADRVQHRPGQRHHDMAGHDPGQPRPPRPAVALTTSGGNARSTLGA